MQSIGVVIESVLLQSQIYARWIIKINIVGGRYLYKCLHWILNVCVVDEILSDINVDALIAKVVFHLFCVHASLLRRQIFFFAPLKLQTEEFLIVITREASNTVIFETI